MYKRFLKKIGVNTDLSVKVYKGFGHENNLIVMGHVLAVSSRPTERYYKSVLLNIFQLFKLFFVKPVADASVVLHWGAQRIRSVTEKDGFFKIEWVSDTSVPAGPHPVRVDYVDAGGKVMASGSGQLFVPHITQLGIISDIDDTFLVSHSATIFRRLWTLFTHNARSRRAFEGVREHYQLLEYAETTDDTPNPIFYVSSSEWNLYDYLTEFVSIQKLPEGIFMLSQLKRWYQLVKTGKTKHEGKLTRAVRIMEAFPKQHFILLGDNSQKDPEIYKMIVEHFPDRIHAVYIRHVSSGNAMMLEALRKKLDTANIPFCFFEHSSEAIRHSKSIGLASTDGTASDIR
jgi:phosphatidate phosphatase APP1